MIGFLNPLRTTHSRCGDQLGETLNIFCLDKKLVVISLAPNGLNSQVTELADHLEDIECPTNLMAF